MIPEKFINKNNIEDILPLTPVQEGMMFYYLNNKDSEMYFEQLSFRVTGDLHFQAFCDAWKTVVSKHPILRTVFKWKKIEKPVQVILKKHEIPILKHDLKHLTPSDWDSYLDKIWIKDRKTGIDIESDPLRILLIELAPDCFEMTLSSYHIILDGWSNGIILHDFFNAYQTIRQGKMPEISAGKGYSEFVNWMNNLDKNKQQQYWRRYLEGLNQKTLLQYDFHKPEVLQNSKSYIKNAPSGLLASIQEFCVNNKITKATFYEFAWGVLLKKYTDNDDVLFGITVSGRNPEMKDVGEIAGLFINTVPVRLKLNDDLKAIDELKRLMSENIERTEYENTPLSDIQQVCNWDVNGRENIFDSIIVVENYPLDSFQAGQARERIEIKLNHIYEMTNYDLTVVINATDFMSIRILYNPGRFKLTTITEMVNRYFYILEQLLQYNIRIRDIFLLNDKEKNKILYEFNKTACNFGKNLPIHDFVEQQSEKTPNLIAVQYSNKSISYKELNKKANRLASYMRKNQLNQGDIAAVAMDRSIDMVVVLLAILKTGAAYLPIDINWPEERILQIIRKANARIIIIDSHFKEKITFSKLQGFEVFVNADIHVTEPRLYIKKFNDLPTPDRTLIDISRYKNKIGMASVNNCISIQTTRGCPYECLYCHKIWSKKHVYRNAENIFDEVMYFYKRGVRNFAVVDDCFNLNMDNSSKFFRLIIQKNLQLQLFFPNGLRGDILTEEYIDLMVEAGTCGINLSLETASPRLQKLLKKNLNLEKFNNVVQYIVTKHPKVLLEMATMHGFPTETEEEAMQTLDFIKSIHWLSFPYVHILKIFPNTEMETFALENGISKDKIMQSRNRAFHELPETLPFPKSFTRQYQASFMKDYFLNRERLIQMLPLQARVLEADAMVQKYNAYLPVEIKTLTELLEFTQLDHLNISETKLNHKENTATIFDSSPMQRTTQPGAMKIILLDLSQQFNGKNMIYNVTEQPLGHMYLLTYLKKVYGEQIDGRILKSGVDFDSYEELQNIIKEYKPDLIGIRTLTIFKEFFHEIVSYLRQYNEKIPIIVGGPYASSDYDTILLDRNVDLVIFGEGEYTLSELIGHMLNSGYKLPDKATLSTINGVAYAVSYLKDEARRVINLEVLSELLEDECSDNLSLPVTENDLAYVMFTSGTTGSAKGVMIEHAQVNNCIWWMQKEFCLKFSDVVIQRTNLTFDPSVWEIFWPLYLGATVRMISYEQSRNAEFLINLIKAGSDVTVMYCPSSMLAGMLSVLENTKNSQLSIPWFLIGAESVSANVVKSFYNFFNGNIINTYGPTECTINNTFISINRNKIGELIPIGKPIANNRIYILSKTLQPMPVNVSGEIYIAGASVARGYLNEQELTRRNFIQSPFSDEILYKTGDLGKWNKQGEVIILGRCDEQIKTRGYRIEPKEIEASIYNFPGIIDCHVTLKGKKDEIISECSLCGVTSQYPEVTISSEGICQTCNNMDLYTTILKEYFKTLGDLSDLIKRHKQEGQHYDALVVYNGGKGTAYALYQLKEMGLCIKTLTIDNGYFSKADIKHIKEITRKLGFDNEVLTHNHSRDVLLSSCQVGSTVCRGCFHMSAALAVEYSYVNNIPVVIGATLSRGQIVENKLKAYLDSEVSDVSQIETDLKKMQRSAPLVDSEIYKHIEIEDVSNGKVYDHVVSVDFYRYCDIKNEEMLQYLDKKDIFWTTRKDYAVYSTNCAIKQFGDYMHLNEKGYHFYGGATSWEVRLGHINKRNLHEDLQCNISEKAYKSFIKQIGYDVLVNLDNEDTQWLCAYVVGDVDVIQLKEEIKQKLPSYMIPSHIIILEKIPLTNNGKIDKKALPEPMTERDFNVFEAPDTDIEKNIADIWMKILKLDRVGINENYFDIGGNSILLIQMHSQIEKLYPGKITITDLFGYSTIHKLAELIERGKQTRIKLPELTPVILPDLFRAAPEAPAQGYVLKSNLELELSSSLFDIAKLLQVDCSDILSAVFGYMLHEVTKSDQISIQVLEDDSGYIIPVMLDFTQYDELKDLFHYMNRCCRDKDNRYLIKKLVYDKIIDMQTGVIPLVITSGSINLIDISISDYDLILETKIYNGQQIEVTMLYNSKILKAEMMKDLFNNYIQDLRALIHSDIGM